MEFPAAAAVVGLSAVGTLVDLLLVSVPGLHAVGTLVDQPCEAVARRQWRLLRAVVVGAAVVGGAEVGAAVVDEVALAAPVGFQVFSHRQPMATRHLACEDAGRRHMVFEDAGGVAADVVASPFPPLWDIHRFRLTIHSREAMTMTMKWLLPMILRKLWGICHHFPWVLQNRHHMRVINPVRVFFLDFICL